MRLAIGSDHAGFELKDHIIKYLKRKKIKFKDFGTFSIDPADYPDFAYPVAKGVASGRFNRGILICGSGVGMSIAANKVRGIRAIACHDIYTAKQSREHGDVNVLCLAGKKLNKKKALQILNIWLKTKFTGKARHRRRIKKIHRIEKGSL